MENNHNRGRIAANTVWTIAGTLVLNGVLQLLIYPRLAAGLGAEANGAVLYCMAFVNILGPSVGQALCNSRLILRRERDVSNGDFNLEILLYTLPGIIVTLIAVRGQVSGAAAMLLIAALILLTNFRYYGDVEYRLTLNYRRFFVYYALCGAGYAAGLLFYYLTGIWQLIFLAGEGAALLFLAVTGSVFRNFAKKSPHFTFVLSRGCALVLSYLITNLSLNFDRLYLKGALGGEAVTVYYVASLIGKTLVLFIAPVNVIVISYLTRSGVRLDRKAFLKLAGAGCAAALVFFGVCVFGTPVFIRLFYPALAEETAGILVTVTLSQILAMLSAYLFIVVLTFTSERWQLGLQCAHLGLTVLLAFVMTPSGGLAGFAAAVLAANACRVAAVLALGFLKAAGQKTA